MAPGPRHGLLRNGVLVGLASHIAALRNPRRGDLVAAAAETGPGVHAALGAMRDAMWATADERTGVNGRGVLTEMPRIGADALDKCMRMDPGTFGERYARFMLSRGIRPEGRPPVRLIHDEDAGGGADETSSAGGWDEAVAEQSVDRVSSAASPASTAAAAAAVEETRSPPTSAGEVPLWYVMCRYREVHDMWHVLFDVPTDLAGETMLKLIEYRQTGLLTPLAATAAGIVNSRTHRQRLRMLSHAQRLPWAWRVGGECAHLMSIEYEKFFESDIEECRRLWRIETCPYENARQRAKELELDLASLGRSAGA